MQAEGDVARRHAVGDAALGHRLLQRQRDVVQAVVAHAQVALAHAAELVDVLHLVRRDLEHPAHLRVGRRLVQRTEQAAADLRQRVLRLRAAQALDLLLHRQGHAHHHRVEEVGLVLEVPVDRAAADAGRGRDLVQRGARDPALVEHAFGGVEQQVAGGARLFLGAAGHVSAGSLCSADGA
ncbi:hypothetical protein ISF6_1275 [Piscinibacter sakaiensis]|uniref:Uncharacterized protein n=1 Tax=Piscinibacter sakaiensis TaxID=1547922 RepID=A0A0K8NYM4_PISS1|nr:hypothetical protein ISF6_1275 [Piscinibacter sakaiensis]